MKLIPASNSLPELTRIFSEIDQQFRSLKGSKPTSTPTQSPSPVSSTTIIQTNVPVPGPAGPTGPPGLDGDPGVPGSPGSGVPLGGGAHQLLLKKTTTDLDTEWGDIPWSLAHGKGTTAAKPAANSVPVGYLYFDDTLQKIQRSNGTVWEDGGGSGGLLGSAYYSRADVVTGTTIIPSDDTIPQSTEGDQYLTVTYTPKQVGSTLVVDASLVLAPSASRWIISALFLGSGANAVAADWMGQGSAYWPIKSGLHYEMTTTSLAPITFKVRAGLDSAGTLTLNGSGGGRRLGGALNSFIRVQETA